MHFPPTCWWPECLHIGPRCATRKDLLPVESLHLISGFTWHNNLWICIGGSDGKESACSAGDTGSIPGSGRSPGEGSGNPLQGCHLEDPMERGPWQATVHGVAKSQTLLSNFTSLYAWYGASLVALVVKNLLANAGDIRDVDSIPDSGRSPGGGHGNPSHILRDRGAWQATAHRVAQYWTQLK